MSFREFTFPQVQETLGLSAAQAEMFAGVAAANLRDDFVATIRVGTDLALAMNTEKARSELIIAPVLLELWRMLGGTFGFFSGVEFDVDAARGLNGVCDFILTKVPQQMILTTVTIDQGHATFIVHGLRDSGALVKAINQAVAAGARTATMFTGEIVNPKLAAKDIKRCERGTTWRGGRFTRLADGIDGPQFRIEWKNLEHITE